MVALIKVLVERNQLRLHRGLRQKSFNEKSTCTSAVVRRGIIEPGLRRAQAPELHASIRTDLRPVKSLSNIGRHRPVRLPS